ncbi:MAG: hypothetical protein QOI24_2277 [Acidobacteriota bacterium]|jgi:hypothetical protein|nr:hypothetical protein [Acidobacteriota bacterium]
MSCNVKTLFVAFALTAVPLLAADHVTSLSDVQVLGYIDRVLATSDAEEWEDLTRLAQNRPAVVVPALLARIEAGRKGTMSAEEISRLAHVVAFAGEDKAVEGLTKLALADSTRYTPFLLECLGYAFDHGAGFSMALLAGHRSESIDAQLAGWIAVHVGQERDAAALLDAIALRHGKDHIDETLETDSLFARLPAASREQIAFVRATRANASGSAQ